MHYEGVTVSLVSEPRLVTLADQVFIGIIEFPKFGCAGAIGDIADTCIVGSADISLANIVIFVQVAD
jgi:hypothetical protein